MFHAGTRHYTQGGMGFELAPAGPAASSCGGWSTEARGDRVRACEGRAQGDGLEREGRRDGERDICIKKERKKEREEERERESKGRM